MKRIRLASIVLVTMAVTASLFASLASAAVPTYGFSMTFGSSGTGKGQFNEPEAITVDKEGNVWVADKANARVQKFNSKGEYLLEVALGEGSQPIDITTDSEGRVWTLDAAHSRVYRLNSFGGIAETVGETLEGPLHEYKGTLGGASAFTVDSGGHVWVAQNGQRVVEVNPPAKSKIGFSEWMKEFPIKTGGPNGGEFAEPTGMAFGPEGNLWITDSGWVASRIQKFNPTSNAYLGQIGEGYLASAHGRPFFDSEGRVWISDYSEPAIKAFNTSGSPKESVGGFGESNPEEDGFSSAADIARDAEGNFWIVDSSRDRVEKWTSAPTVQGDLKGMVVTQPFDKSAASKASYSAKWARFGWATAKGTETTAGWQPASYPTLSGAYYTPTVTDIGPGIASAVTIGNAPETKNYGFGLWLDASGPASTRSGYELVVTTMTTGANFYTVELQKWVEGTKTVLASDEQVFHDGNSIALVDQGGNVFAWYRINNEFHKFLSASDATFSSGNAGLSGIGSSSWLTNFKVGSLLTPTANMNSALKDLALLDSFERDESPLSYGGAWVPVFWRTGSMGANGAGKVIATEGWGTWDAYPKVNGAYWTKSTLVDTGAGNGVAATLNRRFGEVGRHVSLWLDAPSPGSAESGYELRLTEETLFAGVSTYEVNLSKWESGARTVLASKLGYSFSIPSQFALVQKGGVISAWLTGTGSEYAQVLSASDSTFSSGYVGMDAAGLPRLRGFRGGQLPPF